MTKFYTEDIFDIGNKKLRMKYLKFCRKRALDCGLAHKCVIENSTPKLYLSGTRWQFLKYYFQTLLKTEDKMKGIKRWLSFLKIEP